MSSKDKKKLEIYNKFIKEIQELEDKNILAESMIIEKDNYGNLNKKVKSDLTESFLVIETGKNLKELNKRDQDIILEQDSYAKYQNINNYYQKANGLYKIGYYALSIGKWLILL